MYFCSVLVVGVGVPTSFTTHIQHPIVATPGQGSWRNGGIWVEEALAFYSILVHKFESVDLSVPPTFLLSRHIPFTNNSHISQSLLFEDTQVLPQAQRIVSTNALNLLREISHLPFLKLFPDHR